MSIEPMHTSSINADTVEDVEQGDIVKKANVWHLWALGVAGVVSGNYFGWNFVLASGTGAAIISTSISLVFYLALCLILIEFATAFPSASAPHAYVKRALGPIGALIFGISQALEYIMAPSVICVGIGGYIGGVIGVAGLDPLWWIISYAIFLGINIAGVSASFWFSLFIALASIVVLFVFYIGSFATQSFNFMVNAFDIAPISNASYFLPRGLLGIFQSIPFAIWFFLAIEELPLAVREAKNPVRDLPKAMLGGLATLGLLAYATLIISAGSPPGALVLSQSNGPLLESMSAVFKVELASQILAVVALIGLIASFHAIIFAYSRQLESFSKDGFLPEFIGRRWARTNTPVSALVTGAVIGLAGALIAHYSNTGLSVGEVLLKTSVSGALFSYLLVSISYIILKIKGRIQPLQHSGMPYFKNPLGIAGAIICIIFVIATVALSAIAHVDFLIALSVVLCFYVFGFAYYFAVGRNRMMNTSE